MVKLIESSQFDDAAEIGARISEPKSAAMAKEAENVFGQSYDALKPSDPGKYVGIHLTALGDEEAYGCFFAGAPVLTPDGQRPIESLSEGDSVITHTGAVAQIARVFESAYNGARVDVSVTGLPDPIACTADHPFLVVSRRGLSPASRFRLRAREALAAEIDRRAASAEWVRADELEEGDYLVIPTQLASDADIPPAFDPYACGYYLADGCLVREYRDIATRGEFKGVLLSSSVAKASALDRIDAWLASIGRHVPARQTSYTSDAGVRCEILYKEWACWLDDAFGHDGVCKHLSPVIWSWGADDRLAFLAGYFDGDGCVAHRTGARWDGTLVASTASRSLALDLQRLLASVGIPSSVSHGMNRVYAGCFGSSDGDIYALSVGACSAQRILRLTSRLRPVGREFMQHASASMQIGTRYALVRISGVELSETAATKYNLEVPGDNSYVVDVAVHNCNRNFDSFPRSACRLYHDTFVKHGHVFSHHNNDASRDPILGCIKASAYNEKMHRIELFIWADREKAKEGLDTLEKTGECSFSMACSVPWDECFPKGTLVLTDHGYAAIEDISSGDMVVSASDELREVVATSAKPTSRLTRVSVSGFPLDIECTPNHPFLVVDVGRMRGCHGSVNGKPRRHTFNGNTKCASCHREVDTSGEWRAAADLREGDYIKVKCPRSSTTDSVGTSFAYLTGQYLGDGSLISGCRGADGRGERRIMGISISASSAPRDSGIVERLVSAFKTASGKEARVYDEPCGRSAFKVDAYDQLVANRICGLCGAGSRTKFVARDIESWSIPEKEAFLCGLVDSDGCVSAEKHAVRITTVNRGVALSVQRICWSLGIRATCYLSQKDGRAAGAFCCGGPIYGVQFSEFTDTMFSMSDKLSRHPEFMGVRTHGSTILLADGHAYVRITGTYTFDTDDRCVYNIEVAEDHTYNAEGASVHNCSICGNHRRNSRDPNMCDHIRHDLGKMAEDGRVAFMRNVEPDFFDISFVTRPADRIAYSLKVASADPSVPITGERLAKLAGLVEPDYIRPGRAADKHDALRKLADAYERASRGALPGLFAPVAACAASRIDDATVDTLRHMPVKQAMAFLADRGVVLDPTGFCKYAMGPGSAEFAEFAPYTDSIGALAAQIVKDAAFTGRFDVTSTTAFDCDAFTARASRRFTDVASADAVLKRASFADANIQDLAAESVCASAEKRAERGKCSFDGRDDIWFTTHARPVLSTAMKYAEYKVSALASLLHGDACRPYNTNSDALLALVAVQDVH